MLTAKTRLLSIKGEEREIPTRLREKAEHVLDELSGFRKVMVAFSGGIDSTLIMYLAKLELQKNAIAVTADSPSLPKSELEETRKLALQLGVKHIIIRTDELNDSNYTSNPSNRCYFCKKELSEKLVQLAKELGADAVIDGTNADDLNGHRPGAAALYEKGIRRPLADAGISKSEVRELSKLLGLPNFDKPSMPCLSSRVEYGQRITPEKLRRIELSENYVRTITGVRELRVRDHGNLARIEVGRSERHLFFDEEKLDRIAEALRKFGYEYVAFDLKGYRSGSMNEFLSIKSDAEER